MIGNDQALSYLLGRYGEESGYAITTVQMVPSAAETLALQPSAIIFQSVESLETAQPLVRELAECDVPVLVCSSVTDQARARELGADGCLMHPITYTSVVAALTTAARRVP